MAGFMERHKREKKQRKTEGWREEVGDEILRNVRRRIAKGQSEIDLI